MTFSRIIFVDKPLAALSWLGKQGTRAIAVVLCVSIVFPSIGSLFKPYVTEAVFLLLSITFLRVDIAGLKKYIRKPTLVLAATAWTAMAIPLLFGLGCLGFDMNQKASELFLGLMLQAIASPIMAAPALAALMGLDATLVLVTLISSTVLIPITAPLFATVFVGSTLSISPLLLAVKLFSILAGAALVGCLLRYLIGLPTLREHNEKIDGLNIIILFIFAAAVMENVSEGFLKAPLFTIAIAILAVAVYLMVFIISIIVFRPVGKKRALSIGFMASQRNMGLMLAATGGALPELTWLYFALSQLPIYLAPYLLNPMAQRILKSTRER